MIESNKKATNYIDSLHLKMSSIGMKQKVLAKRAGIDPSHLSMIFDHKIMPSLSLYLKLRECISSCYPEKIDLYENYNDSVELPF